MVQNIGARLKGFEIDPFAAWLSQVTLDAVLLPVCRRAGRQLPVAVTVCDSLQRKAPREKFDLVIGNPPYGRVTLPPEDRARYKRSLYGHANLYGLFTDLALSHVRSGGIVAYVTPTSFLAGEYFKNLRALLGREACPVTVDFVASRRGVFEDVLQETLLATYRRGDCSRTVAAVAELTPLPDGTATVARGSRHVPAFRPTRRSPGCCPATPGQAALIERLQAMPHRLADWGYRVSTGPLVWNRFKPQLQQAPRPEPPAAHLGRGHHGGWPLRFPGREEEPRALFPAAARGRVAGHP